MRPGNIGGYHSSSHDSWWTTLLGVGLTCGTLVFPPTLEEKLLTFYTVTSDDVR